MPTKSSLFTARFLIPAGLLLPLSAAVAADVSWDNPGTGAFVDANNWSPKTVPGTGDNAIIANGGTAQLSPDESASVRQLRVNNGSMTVEAATLETGITSSGWQTTGDLQVGASGQSGSLTVSGASTINTGRVRIGGYNDGSEASNVTGSFSMSGGTLTTANGYDFWIGSGNGSTGTMNLSGSAYINVQNSGTAGRNGATATVTQSGTSKFQVATNFAFGEDGDANWTVSDNATLQIGTYANIGQNAGANGTVKVQDSATFTTGGILSVGEKGKGTLEVGGGSVSSGSQFFVGNADSGEFGEGTLTLSDGSVTSSSWFVVGRNGAKGTLEVSGGTLTKNGAGTHFITQGAADKVATVTHTAGTIINTVSETWLSEHPTSVTEWTASGGTGNFADLQVGRDGLATLTLSGTANYTATTVRLGVYENGNGVLQLNGGTLTANSITEVAGSGTVNFNGGTVRAAADSADFFGGFENGDLVAQSGGLVFDTNGHAVAISQGLTGAGGLTKVGAGDLLLSGTNAYTGATVIEGGSLTLGGSNVIADASAVTLDGGTLNINNFNETLAALTLGSTSTIDFGNVPGANTLVFADSSGQAWSGSLILSNFEVGVDTLNFSSADGLTLSQLSAISVSGYYATGLTAGGDVVFAAVPEPEHFAIGALGVLGLAILARRRRQHA